MIKLSVIKYSKTLILIKLEGDYGTDKFSTIHIDYFPCKNYTDNNIVCKSSKEI